MKNLDRLDIAQGTMGKTFVMRFKPGMKIFETIKELMVKENMKYAIIISGVGAIREARIRNLLDFAIELPIGERERGFSNTKGPLELLSLQGSVSIEENGTMFTHGHAVFCGVQPAGAAFGGHLVEAEVYTTTELILTEAVGMRLMRDICPETKGLELKPMND